MIDYKVFYDTGPHIRPEVKCRHKSMMDKPKPDRIFRQLVECHCGKYRYIVERK